MDIPVFLSRPSPYTKQQEEFEARVGDCLEELGFAARTLGKTDYDPEEPLTACRRLMRECNGLIALAFRHFYIEKGWECAINAKQTSLVDSKPLNNVYFTSPWVQIETTMAFSLGLPILVLREKGVNARGLMKKGIAGIYLPEFDLDDPDNDYLKTREWKEITNEWGGWVRAVRRAKGFPPRLY